MENIDKNKDILEAVGILTNDYIYPSELVNQLELAYKTYAFNHISLEEKGVVSPDEGIIVLNILDVLIKGVKGEYIQERKRRKEATK